MHVFLKQVQCLCLVLMIPKYRYVYVTQSELYLENLKSTVIFNLKYCNMVDNYRNFKGNT